MQAKLVIVRGTNAGLSFDIADSITIGRSDECKVKLLDVQASREHCTISFDGSSWNIRDLDSSNGTFVNQTRITSQKLNSGDLIRIGGTIYKFAADAEKPAPAKAKPAAADPGPSSVMTPEEAARLIDSLIPEIEGKKAKQAAPAQPAQAMPEAIAKKPLPPKQEAAKTADTKQIITGEHICAQCGRKITIEDKGIAVELGGIWYCGHCDEWKF